jgi:transposase
MKGGVGSPTIGHDIFFLLGGKGVRRMIAHLKRFNNSSIAQERSRIIDYYEGYGEKAAQEAFGVDRKLIYLWRQRMMGQGLAGLAPQSTKPKKTNQMRVHPKALSYLKKLREDHYRLGKRKIKPLLDEYCQKNDLPIYSEAKIGRIIKKYHLFYQKNTRIYHNSSYHYQGRSKKRRLRRRYSPKPNCLGHIQIDTIQRIVDGLTYYLYTAADIKGKVCLALPYPRANSRNNLDFSREIVILLSG